MAYCSFFTVDIKIGRCFILCMNNAAFCTVGTNIFAIVFVFIGLENSQNCMLSIFIVLFATIDVMDDQCCFLYHSRQLLSTCKTW